MTLTMDPITQSGDLKQEFQLNSLPSVVAVGRDVTINCRVSESSQTVNSDDVSQQQNNWKMATIKEGSKRAKPEAPKFLLLLYEILEVESSSVIRWSDDGLALQILDPVTVTERVLPKYFNHTNFHSFQRQLNYFGFRKWTKSKTDICTFSHPFFRKKQPKLLLLIKRKKAPRRAPAGSAGNAFSSTDTATQLTSENASACGKRKLPVHYSNSEAFPAQSAGIHFQMKNTAAVYIQPANHETPISTMTTPHGVSSSEALTFSQNRLDRHHLPELNNVISPLAATECKKKAKKLKKDFPTSATSHIPVSSPSQGLDSRSRTSVVAPMITSAFMSSPLVPAENNILLCSSSDNEYGSIATRTSTTLPTLNVVRSRLIQRQHASGPGQQQQPVLQQQQQYKNDGLLGFPAPKGPQSIALAAEEDRPELLAQSIAMASAARAELNPGQSPVFPNSFADPVNILLRIKKSRSSCSKGKDVGTKHEQTNDQNENLASLHNYLLGNSLFTNRLQAQLKLIAEENETLKKLLHSKQCEVDTLQGERKVLQQENAVLLEDKNKLFEINRDLINKLFPQ